MDRKRQGSKDGGQKTGEGRLGLGCKMLIRLVFVIWIGTITVLAVVPQAKDGIMNATNVTPSGMEKHVVGYFLGALLFYYGYGKKGAGRKVQGVRCLAQRRKGAKDRRKNDGIIKTEVSGQGNDSSQMSEVGGQRTDPQITQIRGKGQRAEGFYIWLCGFVIFGYSVVLEGVQIFLPYRTFNPYDIVGNGIGVGAFCLIYLARTQKSQR